MSRRKRAAEEATAMAAAEISKDGSGDEISSDSNSDSGSDGDSEIEVDFEFFDVEPDDELELRPLLVGFLGRDALNTMEMSRHIANEDADIGTVITQDNNILGLATVVNIHQHERLEFVRQACKFSVDHCQDAILRAKFVAAFADTKQPIGLIVAQRPINMPPQVTIPLITNLFADMENAARTNPGFHFAAYLVIAPAHDASAFEEDSTEPDAADANSDEESVSERQKRRKRKPALETPSKATSELPLTFAHLEDNAFAEVASCSYRMRVKRDEGEGEYRVVMLIPAGQIAQALRNMSQLAATV